jgi:hypothetical protein
MDPSIHNAFAALGLPTTADRVAVKTEYRRLSLLRYSDKDPAAQKAEEQEGMKVLNAACEALMPYFDWKKSYSLA